MKTMKSRLLLALAALVLVVAAFQHPAKAFAYPCPPGFTGNVEVQEGCCLTQPGTQHIYSFFCVDGMIESSQQFCANTCP
jgi:hypothetical protein